MINKLKILQFSIFSSQAVIMEIQCFHLTHSVLACGFVNDSPALLRVLSLSLRPGQVLFCHRDQVAVASPSVSVAARGDTLSAKWISLIGLVIY